MNRKFCNYVWINKSKKDNSKLAEKLYFLYVVRKQTLNELSCDYWLSKKQIQSLFDKLNIKIKQDLSVWKKKILLIDTTYLATAFFLFNLKIIYLSYFEN